MQLQYIGARYVPIWYVNSVDQSANWEINVEYEPLTWVTTPNNHLYLSKKTVPDNIGTPAQNTEYWLDMGVFSGSGLADLEARVEDLEEGYNTIEDAVSDLQDIVRSINTINNRKFIFISDSYGAMTNLYQDVVSMMGIQGGNYTIQCANGNSFAGNTGTFISRLVDGLGVLDGDTVTDIVVIGGLNDSVNAYTDAGELFTAMSAFNTYAKTNAPNAKIHLGYCGHVDISNANAALRTWHKQYVTLSRYINYAGALGWHYIDNIEYTLHGVRSLLSSDGVHPSVDGARLLSEAVSLGLVGGSYDCKYVSATLSNTLNATVNNATIDSLSFSCFMKDNGITSFTLNQFELTYNLGSINLSTLASDITVSDYPFYAIMNGTPLIYHTSATFYYNDGANKFMECDCTIQFDEGKIMVKPYPFINGSANWATATPKALIIKPVQITMPTIRI